MTLTQERLDTVSTNLREKGYTPRKSRNLTGAVLARTVNSLDAFSQEIAERDLEIRIEAVREEMAHSPDVALKLAVDATQRINTADLTDELQELIREAAHHVLELPTDAHTAETLLSLGRAADDINDPELLDVALEIAEHSAHADRLGATMPSTVAVLREAKLHPEVSFRETIDQMTPNGIEIPMLVSDAVKINSLASVENSNPDITDEQYSWLYAKDNHRQTRASIHTANKNLASTKILPRVT